jgi:hypothetical protein
VSKPLSQGRWLVIIASCVAGAALAVWFVLTDSPWPVAITLVGVWAASLAYRREAGILFWLAFIAATVPVALWLLGYGGMGLLTIFVVLNVVAMAVAKPGGTASGSA